MTIEPNDQYEDIASGYQCAQIAALDVAMKNSGVDLETRQKIANEYFCTAGKLMDQCWTESDEGRHYPVIVFSEKHWESSPERFIGNNGMFSWAEYASGNCLWYYEDNEGDPSNVVMGAVGDDSSRHK